MDFQVAVLCDAATDYEGKLCVLGVFDTIAAAALPASHPQCSVAFRIVFRKEDEGTHQFVLTIVDEDGSAIIPSIEANLEIRLPEEIFFLSRNLVLNLHQLKFEREGAHSIDVSINGRPEISIPLQIKTIPRG
ncbi:MAG: hypothetical protein M3O82_06665 [Verrucomicrobiota bacterium]|nr:hypothetical protein [Verrucomicrobiota bacterium]